MRVLSAAILLVVIFGALWWLPPWATVVLAAGVAWLAAAEVGAMASRLGAAVPSPVRRRRRGGRQRRVRRRSRSDAAADALATVLLALLVAAGAVVLSLGPPDPAVIARASVMIMAPLYVGLPLGVIAWLLCFYGPAVTTWLLVLITVSDSGQYYCGPRVRPEEAGPCGKSGEDRGRRGGRRGGGDAGRRTDRSVGAARRAHGDGRRTGAGPACWRVSSAICSSRCSSGARA